jgi:hypothetical protein
MKNIFLVQTDKPSRLYEFGGEYHLQIKSQENFRSQHIYITSDEEIKDVRQHQGEWQLEKGQILNKFPNYLTDLSECKLVIMTTDPDLIADGVQAIDDDFLEWFVKNPSCESVKVERLDTFKKTNEVYVDEIAGGNYYEIIKQYKIIIPQEETKQETLEKVAKKQWGNVHRTESIDFIAGANLQAERMLTDGDLVKLLDFVSKEYNISNGVGWFHSHESIEDVSSKEVLDKWFEKYKINKL